MGDGEWHERLSAWRDKLSASLWPVPLAMMAGGALLAQLMRWADGALGDYAVLQLWWLQSGSAQDARNLLSTLVNAIMTMSSVVLSITIVALSLAAGQFGSRLIRAYMTNRRTKLALGIFLMTIVYCLLALRTVREGMPPGDIPQLTVTVGLALGIACVATMLLFLHLVAHSMVADEVVRRVSRDLRHSVQHLRGPARPRGPEDDTEAALPPDFEQEAALVRSPGEGYVQAIDYERLVACAAKHDVLVRLTARAGDYLSENGWLAWVHPRARCVPEFSGLLCDAVLLGQERTPVQDLDYSVRHLVDVALRALSPGINDSNTAMVVMDHLRGALARLMEKDMPDPVHRDSAGRVRVVGRRHSHADVVAAAFSPIRGSGAGQPRVMVALLEALEKLCEHASTPEQRDALWREACVATEAALLQPLTQTDRDAILHARDAVRDKLRRTDGAASSRPSADAPALRAVPRGRPHS